jgi:hypothetical protein
VIENTADYAFLMGVKYQENPRCFTCDRTDAVRLVTVRDSVLNRMVLRGYICSLHAQAHRDDGLEIWQNGSNLGLEDF